MPILRRRRPICSETLVGFGSEWSALRYPYALKEPHSPDEMALIHRSGITVLQDVVVRIQGSQACSLLHAVGFKVSEASEMIWFYKSRPMELRTLAPLCRLYVPAHLIFTRPLSAIPTCAVALWHLAHLHLPLAPKRLGKRCGIMGSRGGHRT